MKKLLTLALAITLLAAFASLSTAQMKGEKSPPAGTARGIQEPSPPKVCGTVTNTNHGTKTFIIKEATGKETTVDASAMKNLPSPGDKVEVAYLPGSGDPLKGLNISKSKGEK